jgi:PAS domain S-box-containing protein
MSEHYSVLIVDDDEVDLRAVRRSLRSAGLSVDVTEARDVEGALAALDADTFDCVFLDYQLPGGDGLRVLRTARERGNTTPVVMLTGQSDDRVAVDLMKAGATDYVAKDAASGESLAQVLRHAVRVHQVEEQTRQAERALRESEKRFRILHETSPDGFVILHSVREGGRIVDFLWDYANPAAEQLVGKTAQELEQTTMLDAFPGNRESGLFDLYVDVVENGEPRQTEIHYQYDGMDSWLLVTAAKLDDGFAATFSDITRRKQAEEEREKAIAVRSRFFAAMSHELRTPINAILGYSDLLLAGVYGKLTDPQQQGLERAQSAGRHLLELVNDVLDLSKLEAHKLEIQVEEVSIPALVDDLFNTLGPLAVERGSELEIDVAQCEGTVMTDPRRVRQILLNLISNALKFGEGQPVTVRCKTGADGSVTMSVIDRGIGIAEEDIDRTFEEFVQLSAEERRGTGLGLSISRGLAELLGGELRAQSTLGEGSTFSLWIPARRR